MSAPRKLLSTAIGVGAELDGEVDTAVAIAVTVGGASGNFCVVTVAGKIDGSVIGVDWDTAVVKVGVSSATGTVISSRWLKSTKFKAKGEVKSYDQLHPF